MSRYDITSFKYGLDTRREILTTVNGALTTATNVFVNQGGELVKRLPFLRSVDLNYTDSTSSLQAVFFGLVVDSTQFVVFGSSLEFGATVTQSQPTLNASLPASLKTGMVISYTQLKHPSLYNDTSENYSASLHRMVALPYVSLFNGKSLALAEFSDGNRFLYYDGELVQHSANGLVLSGRTANADLSNDLLRQIEAVNWNGIANTDENGNAQNGSTIVNSPLADYFGTVIEQTTTSGLLGSKFISKDSAETNGVRAIAKFKVTAAGTFELLAPLNEDGTGSTSLMGGTVTAGTVAASVTAIIAGVNDFTSYHGYAANVTTNAGVPNTDEVEITAPEGFDLVTPISLTVNATGGGATGAATGATPFTARFVRSGNGQLSGQQLTYGIGVPSSQADAVSVVGANIGIETTGGAGTTTVAITQLGGASGQPIQARTSPGNFSPIAFSAQLKLNGQNDARASFSIVVTNGTESVTLQLTVYLYKILSF